MSGVYSLIKLLVSIIRNPVSSIKSIDIIAYDKDAMLKLFSVVAAISGAISYLFIAHTVNIGIVILMLILTPFLAFLVYNITAVLVFFSFKLFGREINATYGSIKTVLYPVFLLLLVFYTVNSVIAYFIPYLGLFLRYVFDIWYYVMIFIILKSRLKQSTVRSIAISLIPMYLYLFLLVVRMVL